MFLGSPRYILEDSYVRGFGVSLDTGGTCARDARGVGQEVEAEFRKDVPAKSQIEPWLRFCDALTNSPVASLSLDLTGLGHPATVDPLACALEVMENVSKCYVHDNPIQQNEQYWLESKGNGGTHSHKLPFYELFSGHS